MGDSPYRTAPPAEWPRSLRAVYKIGKAAGADVPVWLICAIAIFSYIAGAGTIVGANRGGSQRQQETHTCKIRSDWDAREGYGVELINDDDDRIARLDTVDAAIDAAAKVGCKVVP